MLLHNFEEPEFSVMEYQGFNLGATLCSKATQALDSL